MQRGSQPTRSAFRGMRTNTKVGKKTVKGPVGGKSGATTKDQASALRGADDESGMAPAPEPASDPHDGTAVGSMMRVVTQKSR